MTTKTTELKTKKNSYVEKKVDIESIIDNYHTSHIIKVSDSTGDRKTTYKAGIKKIYFNGQEIFIDVYLTKTGSAEHWIEHVQTDIGKNKRIAGKADSDKPNEYYYNKKDLNKSGRAALRKKVKQQVWTEQKVFLKSTFLTTAFKPLFKSMQSLYKEIYLSKTMNDCLEYKIKETLNPE